MLDLDWPSLRDALIRIERLGDMACGLLSIGQSPNGGIFVEGGRVCWVAANGLQRRLRDLLRLRSNLDEASLDRLYERCRVEGRLLGQTLVEEGRISANEFEAALRLHSAECLLYLCRSREIVSWSPRTGRGYSPRFTFHTDDLLFDAIALLAPRNRSTAQRELGRLDAPGRFGAAFLLNAAGDTAIPVATLGGRSSVETLSALGEWAIAVPKASREFGAPTRFTLASTSSAGTLSVWWRDSLLFVVRCDDRASVAAVTAHHLGCS